MVSLIFIGFGSLLALAGILALAPQVRKHEIDPRSQPVQIFRAGAVALLAGQMLAWFSPVAPALITVSSVVGWAILFVSLAVASHERQQAGFRLASSLSLQVFVIGTLITGLAFVMQ